MASSTIKSQLSGYTALKPELYIKNGCRKNEELSVKMMLAAGETFDGSVKNFKKVMSAVKTSHCEHVMKCTAYDTI